jgi:outer membrane protein assembly factor BamB
MTTSSVRAGGDRALLAASATLFLLFAVQAGYQKLYVNQLRSTTNPDLLAELGEATILEDGTPPSPTVDWPQWRGPRRDGVAHDPGLLTGWPDRGPKELWRVKGGGGFSSFAVGGGRAFTLLGQEGGEVVVCWEAGTGQEVWRHPYEVPFSVQYGGPRSTPTLDGDRLYTVGAAGRFHCFDAATGSVLWQHDLLAEFKAPRQPWGVAFSPLVEGDLVLTSPGGPGGKSVAAFHKETGQLAWTALDDPAAYSSPIALTAGGVRQVVFFTARHLVGLSPAGGKVLWQYPWETSSDVNAATPLAFRARTKGGADLDYVFISSGYGRGCALVKVVADGAGGFEARSVYTSNELCLHFSSPVRYRDHLYAIDEKRYLTCMDLRTGAVRWRHRDFLQGSLLRVDERLLVLGGDGKLALVEADPSGFRGQIFHRPGQPSRGRWWTVPVLAGGKLYLRDEEEVLCLDLRKPD